MQTSLSYEAFFLLTGIYPRAGSLYEMQKKKLKEQRAGVIDANTREGGVP